MIQLIAFDIDGVLTDGTVIIDSAGNEQKRIDFQDIDAIFELHRRGFRLAAITGEDTPIVNYFAKRFPWDFFYRGSGTKKEILQRIESETGIPRESICYVGDGKYDAEPVAYAGLGICPADAIDRVKEAADVILQKEGGKGCVWELVAVLESYNAEELPEKYFLNRLQEHTELFKRLASDRELMGTVMSVADRLMGIFGNGGTLFLCGNGGSAADAQHIATEFVSRFYMERPGLNAEALTVNTSTLTAIGNDYSFERIFARQLEAKARKGDMLIGISTSGKSVDVLEAFRYANEHGILSVLLTGAGDIPKEDMLAEYIIRVPAKVTPRIQEAHIFIGHVIAEYVEHAMFGENGCI